MLKKSILCASLALSLSGLNEANARLVQILHTNDTHSFLNNATHSEDTGGSSRLKSLIDYYKDQGRDQGIETITMDGGDFLEGNIYYMADHGLKSFEVHNQVGYDAVVLGNHDYLMGAKALDELVGKLDLNFSFLAANLNVSSKFPNLRKTIKPYKEIEIDGIKIGIIGLTTNDFFYSWSFEDSRITNPYDAAKEYETILKKRNNDFIFALTHIGVSKDKRLASKSKYIDLIVGGHSHTELKTAIFQKNKSNRMVPIVQAGKHTEYLGRMIIDIEKGQPLKVVSSELVPIKYIAEDSDVKNLVQDADYDLDKTYGTDWLDEEVGYSALKKDDETGSKKWSAFIADAIREKAKTDVSIHVFSMNGENFPVGSITRRSIINSIPRVFDLKDKYGWAIYTTKISGFWLNIVCETLAHFGEPISFGGITLNWIKTPIGLKVARATINGKRINPLKMYSVAFTEGIVVGALEVTPKVKLILKNPQKTPHKIWQTLEEKVSKDRSHLVSPSLGETSIYMPEVN